LLTPVAAAPRLLAAAPRPPPPDAPLIPKPLLLLLKGHPGSGKSALAAALAAALGGAVVLDKDEHRRRRHAGEDATGVNEAAYAATASALAAARRAGARSIVVDSPLSSRARWDAFAGAAGGGGAGLVLIEVACSDASLWRSRLEARAAAAPPADGHKPATWGELQALVASYGGSDSWPAAARADPPWALRLVLDTATAPPGDLASAAVARLRAVGLLAGAGVEERDTES